MIARPYPITPQHGPLAAPSEEDAAAAHPELRDQALTLAWSAEALQAARRAAGARAGEQTPVRPWPLADASGRLSRLRPLAWQLLPGARGPHSSLPTVHTAAAEAGWTNLELHRFTTAPLGADGATPAALLQAGEAERVAALIHGEPPERPAPRPVKTPHRPRRRIAPYGSSSGRHRRNVSTIGGAR
jgi:hypothetical protein